MVFVTVLKHPYPSFSILLYNKAKNLQYMRMLDERKAVRCANGVDKYL